MQKGNPDRVPFFCLSPEMIGTDIDEKVTNSAIRTKKPHF
jgi:hypothetical protein